MDIIKYKKNDIFNFFLKKNGRVILRLNKYIQEIENLYFLLMKHDWMV